MFSELWLMEDAVESQSPVCKPHFFLPPLPAKQKGWERTLHWRQAKQNVEKIITGYVIKEEKLEK